VKTTAGTAPRNHAHPSGEFVSVLSANGGQVSSGRGAVTGGEIRASFGPAFSPAMIGQERWCGT